MPSQPGIFDVANQSKPAVIARNIMALVVGILFIAGGVWADNIELAGILWRHWAWTFLGGAAFLLLFPIVTYIGVIVLTGGRYGFGGFLLGTVFMLFFFFLRSLAYCYICYGHRKLNQGWGKGESAMDAAYGGLIGGSPSKKTGLWSLPIRMGSSSGASRSDSKGGGRFGGGGAGGRY